jgi:hypothetical protein
MKPKLVNRKKKPLEIKQTHTHTHVELELLLKGEWTIINQEQTT